MPNPTVFIAEDDNTILELLRIRLGVAGYATLYARDGIAAIAGIGNSLPNAVVLDIGLPKCDGFEVLQALRANVRTRNIPVLVLTARHDASDVQRAIACGAQDYLAKPFDDQKLLARVARLLKKVAAPMPGGEI
jgi:two-component system OmpR family response regulator